MYYEDLALNNLQGLICHNQSGRARSASGSARGVMVIVVGNGHGIRVQIKDEADCISHSTNTLGKGLNPIILPLAMGR